jgi:hypothetical protein
MNYIVMSLTMNAAVYDIECRVEMVTRMLRYG